MNPFIRRATVVLMMTIMIALHLAPSAASAGLPPEANYLGRITGVIAPVRLAMDTYQKLYVADPRSGGVLQYDNAGKLINKFPLKGARGVAITSVGELVVTHGNAATVINTDTGATIFPLTSFKQANGVAVDDTGLIYIVDTLDSVVKVFLGNGQLTKSFGIKGSATGQLSLPTAIAFDKVSKQLIVSDTGNSRLMIFDKDGTFIRSIGSRAQNGTAPTFTSPQSVSLEYTKTNPVKLQRIYVSDSFQSEVQIIDPQGSGTSLGSIGGYGTAPGKLKVPVDTLFDPTTSRLFVANGAGDVTIYGINTSQIPVQDTTAPILSIDTTPATTYTNALVIGGTVEKEAQIQITASSVNVVVGAVNYYPHSDASLKYWQAAISALNPAPATNTITVIARDSAANATTTTFGVNYNASAPVVNISAFAAPVKVKEQALSGTADANAVITLTGPSGVTFLPNPVVFDAGTTTWRSTVSGLGAGINTITATATAADGSSSSATTRITLITTPPDLVVSTLPNGSKTAQAVLNVSGTLPLGSYFGSLTANGKPVTLTVNGEPVTILDDAFSTSVTLKPGENTITITALDAAGNKSETIRTITLDETLPTVALTEPADGAYVNGTSVILKGTVTVKPGNTVRVLLYNDPANIVPFAITPVADGSWTTPVLPLDPGLNTIVVEVTDAAGKISTIKTTITRDDKVPALAVTGPIADKSVNSSAQTVTGTVTAGSEISVTLNGTSVPVTQKPDGTYSIPVILAEEKQYALAITATDALGNSVTTYRNLVYDITAPTIPTTAPATPLKVTFSDGLPVVFYDSLPLTTGFTITTNAVDGSKTVEVSAAAVPDLNKLDIHAVDAAGNSTRNGDVDGSGKVDIKDAFKMLRLALGLDVITPEHKLRGDVAPLLNGVSKPDGVLDVFDVVYILEKSVGLR